MANKAKKTGLRAMSVGAMATSNLIQNSPCLMAGLMLASMALPVWAQSAEFPGEGQSTTSQVSEGGVSSSAMNKVGSDGIGSGIASNLKRAWSVTPRVTVTETLTDNVEAGSSSKQRDQITEIAPGILINGESARLKGRLDYQLHEMVYAQNSQRNQTQQSLNSFGTLEAIEKWLFVDASGMISQQSISAFGSQSASNTSVNSNRTETSSFQVSPYVRGKVGSFADYDLRYRRAMTRSKSDLASDVDTDGLTANVRGVLSQLNLDWSLEGSSQRVDYSRGRTSEEDRLRGVLSYRFDPQFSVSINGGTESNDYASLTKERKTNSGFGFEWAPTERTRLAVSKESRFFGEGHSLSFSHRTPLMAITYSDSRDISVLPNQFTSITGTNYDLLFSQLTSQIPDPVARDQQVNNLLQKIGLPRDAIGTAGFLASQVSVQRLRMLSLALNGVRNVVTFIATQSESQSLGVATSLVDDFALSPTIKQRGYNVNWSYLISPLSSVNAVASQQDSISQTAANLDSRQKTLTFNFMTKLGGKTTLTLGARRAIFDRALSPYTENAMIGTISIQF